MQHLNCFASKQLLHNFISDMSLFVLFGLSVRYTQAFFNVLKVWDAFKMLFGLGGLCFISLLMLVRSSYVK